MKISQLVIYSFLITVSFHGAASSCHSKTKTALAQIEMMNSALSLFRLEQGRYPTTSEGLPALAEKKWEGESGHKLSYVKRLPDDPWGNPYQYRYPGVRNPASFDLWSNGADGKPGGEGVFRDCGNWDGGNCDEKPMDFDKIIVTVLLAVSFPLFWFAFYLGYALYRFIGGTKAKEALHGRHLDALICSLPLHFAVSAVLWTLTGGC